MNWDSVARRYVERSDDAQDAVETFAVWPMTEDALSDCDKELDCRVRRFVEGHAA